MFTNTTLTERLAHESSLTWGDWLASSPFVPEEHECSWENPDLIPEAFVE